MNRLPNGALCLGKNQRAEQTRLFFSSPLPPPPPPPQGGTLKNIWVGVCHWDYEILTLNQTKFSGILQPYTRLKTKNPFPITDSLFSRNSVTITVLPKQNLICVQQQQLKHVFLSVNSRKTWFKFLKQLISFLENYTLFWTKTL